MSVGLTPYGQIMSTYWRWSREMHQLRSAAFYGDDEALWDEYHRRVQQDGHHAPTKMKNWARQYFSDDRRDRAGMHHAPRRDRKQPAKQSDTATVWRKPQAAGATPMRELIPQKTDDIPF